MSWQPLDGFSWNLVQTFMPPSQTCGQALSCFKCRCVCYLPRWLYPNLTGAHMFHWKWKFAAMTVEKVMACSSWQPSCFVLCPDRGKSFVDVLDAQWECEGELIPLDPSVLNPREFLVYQHGLFLMHTLRNLKLVGAKISLLLSTLLHFHFLIGFTVWFWGFEWAGPKLCFKI